MYPLCAVDFDCTGPCHYQLRGVVRFLFSFFFGISKFLSWRHDKDVTYLLALIQLPAVLDFRLSIFFQFFCIPVFTSTVEALAGFISSRSARLTLLA